MPSKLCSCGFPQSFPIPHEHDQTEREKQIIAFYESKPNPVAEALERVLRHSVMGHEHMTDLQQANRMHIPLSTLLNAKKVLNEYRGG